VAVPWSLRFPLLEIFNAESGELKQIARSLRMRFRCCSSGILSFGGFAGFWGAGIIVYAQANSRLEIFR